MLKRFKFSTVMVDLYTHKVIDMIPSRKVEDVVQWLKTYPNLKFVVRDGASFYRKAIKISHPEAIQVSDRFHYTVTVTKYFHQAIIDALPSRIKLNNEDLDALNIQNFGIHQTESKAKQQHTKLRQTVCQLVAKGMTRAAVAKHFSISRRTVQHYLSSDWSWHTHPTHNALKPYLSEIVEMYQAGKNKKEIYKHIVAKGYQRTYSTFLQYIKVLYRLPLGKQDNQVTATQIASLVYRRKGNCSYTPVVRLTMLQYPEIKKLLSLLMDFIDITTGRSEESLDDWIRSVKANGNKHLSKVCDVIKPDKVAINNSVKYPHYSNGPVEGLNNRTKTIKRAVYGRCSFLSLKERILLIEKYGAA